MAHGLIPRLGALHVLFASFGGFGRFGSRGFSGGFRHAFLDGNELEVEIGIVKIVIVGDMFTAVDLLVEFSDQMNCFSSGLDQFQFHQDIDRFRCHKTIVKGS